MLTFGLLPTNFLVSAKTNSMKCFVNWVPLNTHVRSQKTKPYLTSSTFMFRPLPINTFWISGMIIVEIQHWAQRGGFQLNIIQDAQ